MTPHLVLANNLLRLPAGEIETVIRRELAENPALEIDEDRSRSAEHWVQSTRPPRGEGDPARASLAVSGADDEHIERVVAPDTVMDVLIAQVRLMVDEEDLDTAIGLLQSLDAHGYLAVAPERLATDLGVPLARVADIIGVLHQLTPPGIGARDMRECLLIQCADLEAQGAGCALARRILEKAWDDFARLRWDRVARLLQVPRQSIDDAVSFMRRNFYPYPLLMVEDTGADAGVLHGADVIVRRTSTPRSYAVEIPYANLYALKVSASFERMRQQVETGEPADNAADDERRGAQQEWANQSVSRANEFIYALNQRWATLRRIAEYLVDYQAGFFERGPRHLRPLTRAALAGELGLHESTISRAISDKTIQLPDGRLIPLSDLFDSSLAAKEAIRRVVGRAGKPLSDREIVLALRAEEMNLARRTVTKYRGELGIPAMINRQAIDATD